MSFTLEDVVPWGRSFDEYVEMFALTARDLDERILGCGDGPASFNSVLTARGGRVVSVDPIYRFSGEEIGSRIDEAARLIGGELGENSSEFVWRRFASVEELLETRMAAMNEFLADYAPGLTEGRYVDASLPVLPFADREFGLALCSHLLFLYSEQLDLDLHVRSIRELCRVATEVRIFPLLELGSRRSRHVEPAIRILADAGFVPEVGRVPYEFQRGGNEMLVVRSAH